MKSAAKKKAVKSKAKKAAPKKKPSPKKKKEPSAVAAPAEYFQVKMEQPMEGQAGVTLTDYTGPLEEREARNRAEELKQGGVGGRLIKLDGSPDGVVVEKWPGVEGVTQAEETEKAAHPPA